MSGIRGEETHTRAATEAPSSSHTVTITEEAEKEKEKEPKLTLKLKKPETGRYVKWGTDVVDNEHMNKKKSKCCCVYHKPRAFDESSSDESDNECDHCRGHKSDDYKGNPTGGEDSSHPAPDSSQRPVGNSS